MSEPLETPWREHSRCTILIVYGEGSHYAGWVMAREHIPHWRELMRWNSPSMLDQFSVEIMRLPPIPADTVPGTPLEEPKP